MGLSREARLMVGLTLLTVPTIMYGGLTLLGMLTRGTVGLTPPPLQLNDTQWALFRAGHAHAGVWLLFSLVIQVLLDAATLSSALRWIARVSAPLAAILISGGFFGLAFDTAFRALSYLGALALALSVIVTGVGLLRRPART